MSAIANLIYQTMANRPDPAKSFIQGANAGQNRALVNEQIQTSQAARQKQSALQGLIAQGATPEQMIQAGYVDEGKAYKDAMEPSKQKLDLYKEERAAGSKSVESVNKRATEIRGAYGKLDRLAERAKAAPEGSLQRRQAINSMIANVVRLNSPGIVSETELQTYTGGQGTTAALVNLLAGRDVDYKALMAYADPSGADPEGLLGVGRSLILGEAQPLFDVYDDAYSRASRSGMSKEALDTIFGKYKNIDELRSLYSSFSQPETPALAPEQQRGNPNKSLDDRAKALGL